jgi:hypothetical protein
MGRTIRILFFITMVFGAPAFAQQPAARWYKGNTHTHTLNSDGDSTPDEVVRWYRENGYNFVFITDHEYVTPVAPLNELLGKPGAFLVLSGQEVTDSVDRKPYHINGLGLSQVVQPARLATPDVTLQRNIDNVRRSGGIAQVNHPNFGWALDAETLISLRDYTLLEIFNGHPLVNNLGGGGSPSAEEIWDRVLSAGKVAFGAATDDSHVFKRPADRSAPLPGRGWIFVRARELTQAAIIEAIRSGDFYASTGVELSEYSATAKAVTVSIKEERNSRYRVQFIGTGGRALSESVANPAIYEIRGGEGYVRARVIESNGKMAWTQPHFVRSR